MTRLIVAAVLMANVAYGQNINDNLTALLKVPKQYSIPKVQENITIDGKDTEMSWKTAPVMSGFGDIEGKSEKNIPYSTVVKMLWNDSCLYIYAQLEQPQIWATLKEQDQSIFSDHALEIFMDPDGDGQNYVEFQINAFEAVWDLVMSKPYRNGGVANSNWDVKGLKKAVFVNGTLNVPGDKDNYWGIELSIPFRSIVGGRTFTMRPGTIWRMNFARVDRETEIVEGKYTRKRNPQGAFLPASYTVWSPQGLINLHYPERWGFVQFVNEPNPGPVPSFLDNETLKIKLALWKFYYLQQEFKAKNGKYAVNLGLLRQSFPQVPVSNTPIRLIGTELQFILRADIPTSKTTISIDHESKQTEVAAAPGR